MLGQSQREMAREVSHRPLYRYASRERARMIEFRVSRLGCNMGNCVEIGQSPDGAVLMRDTKNPAQQALTFTDEEWVAFVAGVKAGEFDFA
jgi:predicted DNA-binding transcriptional regulator YafY